MTEQRTGARIVHILSAAAAGYSVGLFVYCLVYWLGQSESFFRRATLFSVAPLLGPNAVIVALSTALAYAWMRPRSTRACALVALACLVLALGTWGLELTVWFDETMMPEARTK